jgi:hypothetical protein
MISEQLKVELHNYEGFADGFNSGLNIKWIEREGCTETSPIKLDEDWLRYQLTHMATVLKKYDPQTNKLSPRTGYKVAFKRESLTDAAKALLFAVTLPIECEDLLNACLTSETWIPLTVPRINHTDEPCGKAYDPSNLGPEYIRHFMRVFYDEDHFTETLGQKFFPFENRDHLVHSFLVFLMGQVLLSAPVDEKGIAAVANILGESPDRLSYAKTIGDLAEHVYTTKKMAPRGTSPAQWLKRVWPAVALWHDSGYDAATWSLLTWRLFSHSFAVKTVLEAGNVAVNVFEKVSSFLDDDLEAEMRKAILRSKTVEDGYRHLWCVEECHVQSSNKRPWGRYHALFSAFEFIELLRVRESPNKAPECRWLRHLGAAIANHHEQSLYEGRELSSLTDEDIAKTFVKSPIGSILAFADLMSGFARTRLKSNNHGGFDLEIEYDQVPLFIWRPRDKTRLAFCRGTLPPDNPPNVKMRALWGDFLEKDPKNNATPSCSRQTCTLPTYGGY